MFGRKKNEPGDPTEPPTAPEGQAGYTPIDDEGGMGGGDSAPGETDRLLASLRSELDEVNDRWKRAMADFQNYQRRALQNERDARREGAISVVTSVVPVLDHFDLALNQKADGPAAGIIEGVKVIRAELIRALEKHGVKVISPGPNDAFDPMRHEAIAQQAGEGIEPGHITATFQPGFELGERIIRPAKVAVAPSP